MIPCRDLSLCGRNGVCQLYQRLKVSPAGVLVTRATIGCVPMRGARRSSPTACPGIFEQMSDEELANLDITLIHQATYMLRRLIERQQEMFVENGGIRERMSRARRSPKK